MGLFSKKKQDKPQDRKENESKKKSVKKEEKPKSMKELYGDSTSKKAAKSDKNKPTSQYGEAYRVLIKPLVTEKAANLSAENKYVFAVTDKANKIEIARAVRGVYGVEPVKVNIVRVKGKQVRYGRILGKRKDWKKAIVTLPAGKSINVYEGV